MFLKRKQIALKDLLTKNGKNDFSLGNDFKKAINEAQKEKRQMTSIYCWNYIEGQFEISRFDYEQIHYGYHINQYDVLDFFRSLRDMPVYTGNEPSKPKPIKAWIIRNISVIYTRRNTWTFILVMTTVLSMVPVTILYWKIGFVIMYCILILFFGPFFFWCLTRIADKSLKKIQIKREEQMKEAINTINNDPNSIFFQNRFTWSVGLYGSCLYLDYSRIIAKF